MRRVLLAGEVDPGLLAHFAVSAVAPDDVTRRLGAAVGELDHDPLGVLTDPCDLGTPDDLHAQLTGARLQQALGTALRHDQHHGVTGLQRTQIEHGAGGGLQLLHGPAERHQIVRQSAGVEQFERTGVHGERPRQIGLLGPPLQQPATHTGPSQLARQHEAGRAGAYDDHVGGVVHRTLPSGIRCHHDAIGAGALESVKYTVAVTSAPAPPPDHRSYTGPTSRPPAMHRPWHVGPSHVPTWNPRHQGHPDPASPPSPDRRPTVNGAP